MPENFDVHSFFDAVINKDADRMRIFFEDEATIIWANTNEQFTVEEYLQAICKSTGERNGKVEDFEVIEDSLDAKRMVFVAKFQSTEGFAARTVSFIDFANSEDELIEILTEYWSDIIDPPAWRQERNIGTRYDD